MSKMKMRTTPAQRKKYITDYESAAKIGHKR